MTKDLFNVLRDLKNNLITAFTTKLEQLHNHLEAKKLDKKLTADDANKFLKTDLNGKIITVTVDFVDYDDFDEECKNRVHRKGDSMYGPLEMQDTNIVFKNTIVNKTCTIEYDSDDECLNFNFSE